MKITAEQLEQLTGLECAADVAAALRAMGIETDDPAPYVRPVMTQDDLVRAAPIPRSLIDAVTRDNVLLKLLKANR